MDRVAAVLRDLSVTPDEIANRAKLPIERVRALLNGAKATSGDLRALSRGLRIPFSTFATGLSPSGALERSGLKFRSAPTGISSEYEPVLEQVATFVDAALKILPKRARLPDWIGLAPPEENYEVAKRLADRFRDFLFSDDVLGPANDLPQRVEMLDGIVFSHLRQSKYEGASLASGGYVFIFVSPRFAGRMLFTFAHELGHILAHHSIGSARFERASEIGKGSNRSERFVDAFAGNLLIPDHALATFLSILRSNTGMSSDALGDIEILYLARFFGVSFEVAARRCEDLSLLPLGGAVSLSEHLRRNFQSPEKRAEALGLPPRALVRLPVLSKALVDALFQRVEAGEVSLSWAADRLGVSVSQIYSLNARRSDDALNRH